jgi:hypothetical protein
MKRRILSLLLVLALLCGLLPGAYAASGSAIWPGSGNLPGNNQVTDAPTPTQSSEIGEKWTYPLNDTVDSWGAYYAGQSVIADDALFATGGGYLHRVDLETGTGTVSEDAAGTTEWVYDFLCWGDGVVFVATSTSIAAFDADTLRCLGTVDGSFGTYCPVQYHDGVVACGGWLYTYEDGTFTLLGGPGSLETFNWSSGAFVGDYYYLTGQRTLYTVDAVTGEIVDQFEFDATRTTYNQGGTVYDADTDCLYWATSYASKNLYSIALGADSLPEEDTLRAVDVGQDTVSAPVVCNGRVYVAGQEGMISVVDAETMTLCYTTNAVAGKIQSTPVVSTATVAEDGQVSVYVQAYDKPGNLYVLRDGAGQESGTLEQLTDVTAASNMAYAFEQLAVDDAGNLYFYNESGTLYCWGPQEKNAPVLTTDLDGGTVRYTQGEAAQTLQVAADGEVQYQWYRADAADGQGTAIDGADKGNFTPSTDETGTWFYYCLVTGAGGSVRSKTVCVIVTGTESVTGTVYVTLGVQGEIETGREGTLLADAPVVVTDRNQDGALDLDETLYAFHEQYYADGAAGYAAGDQGYGLSLLRLWGDESGAFGYYCNNTAAVSLAQTVSNGDRVKAWIYADQQNWSDLYTWFDAPNVETKAGAAVTLTLHGSTWQGEAVPAGAVITVRETGEETVLDEQGSVKLTFSEPGTYTVLATSSQSQVMLPSACTVSVKSGGSGGGTEDRISISFTLLGDEPHGSDGTTHTLADGGLTTWIAKTTVQVDADATVADAISQVLTAKGYKLEGLENGYITAVTTPDGLRLAELDNGKYAGWMYTLNGKHPDESISTCSLSNGDRLVFHYTDNYTLEESGTGGSGGSGGTGSSTGTSGTTTDTAGFTDVAGTAWYASAVQTAVEQGWMQGVSETQFVPNGEVSRAMAVQTLYNLADGTAKDHSAFSDVAQDSWYADAVTWAVETGIVSGYDDGTFRPGRPVSREELAVMLYRFAKTQNVAVDVLGDLSGYTDANQIRAYAASAMRWCCAAGLLTGRSETLLCPDGTTTRAELATILTRWPGTTGTVERTILDETAAGVLAATPNPAPGSTGGEWAVIGLRRGGCQVDEVWYDTYWKNLTSTLQEKQGVLSDNKYTEYARTVLAVLALEQDPQNVAGYDLLAPLQDTEQVMRQGINGAIWALVAIDAAGCPSGYEAAEKTYLQAVLDAQLPDGGFALSGQTADPDLTAMALCALACHQEDATVAAAGEAALNCLSKLQQADGSFSGWQGGCESTAQVLLALCQWEISLTDTRFVKNGCTVLDALVAYALPGGGFCHSLGGERDAMATEQALCALAALARQQSGLTPIYEMR